MQEFKEGQRVKVEFEGEILTLDGHDRHDSCAKILDDDGFNNYIFLGSDEVKVTLADPKDWPPRKGDVWAAEGDEWFTGYSRPLWGDELVLTSAETRNWHSLASFKALNPVLVRRRGQ